MDSFDISLHTNRPPLNSPEPSFEYESDSKEIPKLSTPEYTNEADLRNNKSSRSPPLETTKYDTAILERVLKFLPINAKYGERKELWTRIAKEINESKEFSNRTINFRVIRERFYTLYKLFIEKLDISKTFEDSDFTNIKDMDRLLLEIYTKDKKYNDSERDIINVDNSMDQTKVNESSHKIDLMNYKKTKLLIMKDDLQLKREFIKLFRQEMANNNRYREEMLKLNRARYRPRKEE